ncbi:MAG: DEAD/DEAH box helicase [Proteobacteria bacterium]|nr:DEAD/DEAH box helicase [Pseudomonadota bacterium]
MTEFTNLGLATPILKALAGEGYTTPTPIQAQAIPHILRGSDLLGIAQTGTGKTAAFATPILHRLSADRRRAQPRACRVLVLSPTRELASQIAESFRTYGRHLGLSTAVAFGGVPDKPQARAFANGVDVLVATPGRLLDHLGQRTLRLDQVETFVLDEADRMLDMGFIHDIRRIVRTLPAQRQSLFFSATMPKEAGALAADLLRDPVRVAVTPSASTVELVDQHVIFVDTAQKRSLLAEILRDKTLGRILVFTRTKHGADRVVRHLDGAGIESAAIHGNKSQNQRERALAGFRSGQTRVLVATDIAARGIDVDGVTHVINFDLPNIPESYVHRIGRTARAGAAGIAISFCDAEERAYLRDIESLIRQRIAATDRRSGGGAAPQPNRPRNGSQQHGHRPQHANGPAKPAPRAADGDLTAMAFLQPARPHGRTRFGNHQRRAAAR